VVFADWLFFGLTAGALVLVRLREGRSGPPAAFAFIVVAAGIVVNSFIAYPTQSLIGSAILGGAAVAFFATGRPKELHYTRVG
jgi:hypothetical protein